MPISSTLKPLLDRSLSNKILSKKEIKRIERDLKADGNVSADEVKLVVDSLVQAVSDGLELDTPNRRKRLNNLISALDAAHDTGLEPTPSANGRPSFLGAINARIAAGNPNTGVPTPGTDVPTTDVPTTDGPTTDVPTTDPATGGPTSPTTQPAVALGKPAFGGGGLSVQAGSLHLDGKAIPLDLSAPTDAHLDALVSLARPGTLDSLAASDKEQLASNLTAMVAQTWPVPADGDQDAFKRAVGSVAAVASLRSIAPHLNTSDVDALIAAFEVAPNPMAKSQLLAVLANAPTTAAQKAAVGGLKAPEHEQTLIETWDAAAKDGARIEFTDVSGEMQKTFLEALVFAKKPTSIENVEKGLKTYAKLNDSTYRFDDAEGQHAHGILEGYVNKHGGLGYVFGTFHSDAPRNVAKVHNERLVAAMLPALDAAAPSFKGVPLTKSQATVLKEVLAGLENDGAANKILDALSRAATFDSPTSGVSWRPPATPATPLSPAAFNLFERIARPYVRDREGTDTGMTDAATIATDVRAAVDGIRAVLQPRMAELGRTPPSWNGVEVGPSTAAKLKQLASNHLRSSMSVENIDRAMTVFADANGGAVTGIAEQRFSDMVDGYQSNWPDLQTFDYNKLERIARFAATGKSAPLATIDGKEVGLAKFYGDVAAKVTGAVDKSVLRHEWIADRWGFRAREAVELLDVVAEQTARGEGPISELRRQYPNAEVSVRVMGTPGAHEQFLFTVKEQWGRTTTFNQGSDGTLSRYRGRTQFPELLGANIHDDGSLHLDVPSTIRTYKYPTQSTYTVGDSIDVPYFDGQATEVRTAGEKFETRSKVVEGTITGFSANGTYSVEFKTPGTETVVTKEMSQSEIRKANHPHYFKEEGSYLRDVDINLNQDKELKDFLDGADGIIAKHLPRDGSLAQMDAATLSEHQQNAMKALMEYAADNMKYPNDEGQGPEDTKYRELDSLKRFPLGELVKINRGVCRHQCILFHLLLQRAGIDSRLASGSANTSGGDYRGLHLWVETTLADGSRFLSDQTWKDEAIPLWAGAYDRDQRRQEIHSRTTDFDRNLANG